MKLERTTAIQPSSEMPIKIFAAIGFCTCQITPSIGRHCQISTHMMISAMKTKVLRSSGFGMNCVHHCLKAGRAMMVCWTPKMRINRKSTRTAVPTGPTGPESTDLGIGKWPRNPIMYTIQAMNPAYAMTP